MFYGQRVLDYDTPTCLRATRCDLNTDYRALRATEHSLVHGRAPPGIPLRDLATRNVLRAPTARVLNLEPYIPRFFDGAGSWTTASPRCCGPPTSLPAFLDGAGPRPRAPPSSLVRAPGLLRLCLDGAGPRLHSLRSSMARVQAYNSYAPRWCGFPDSVDPSLDPRVGGSCSTPSAFFELRTPLTTSTPRRPSTR